MRTLKTTRYDIPTIFFLIGYSHIVENNWEICTGAKCVCKPIKRAIAATNSIEAIRLREIYSNGKCSGICY